MADQSRVRSSRIKSRQPLRIAAIQIKYVPNHRSTGPGLHLLAQEPLVALGYTGPGRELLELFVNANYETLRRSLRTSIKDLLETQERASNSNFDKKLRRILKYCHEHGVDIAVFPECSVPPNLVSTLLGFPFTVFAGIGMLRKSDIPLLAQLGFELDENLIGANAAVYITDKVKLIVTKQYAAEGENIQSGTGVQIAQIGGRIRDRNVGLAICKDYLRGDDLLRNDDKRIEILLTAALTRTTADFRDPPPRDFIRVFANWTFDGDTAVVAPNLRGLFVRESQTEPVPRGEEAVIIVDWDFFQARLTPLDLPNNRLVRYAAILDSEDSGDGEKSLGESVRDMTGWNLADYRAGAYTQRLRVLRDHFDPDDVSIIGRAVNLLSEQDEDGIDLTSDDFTCLTSHIVLDDVLREEELRYRLLDDIIERWHQDRRTFPSPESGRFIAAAEGQRRQLETRIRPRYRSRQVSRTAAGRAFGREAVEPLQAFYAARLGTYTSERAVATLPRQLDLLSTVAASKVESLRLVYRISTRGRGPDDLFPVFDVIAAADADECDLKDLVTGIGEQIGTVFSGGWDLLGTDAGFGMNMPWVAQFQLASDYVPAIQEDWAPLVDYLRTLGIPTQVQFTISPCREPVPTVFDEVIEHPSGFLSSTEQAAAAYFMRAAQAERLGSGAIRFMIHVAAQEALPTPALQTIARWLLRSGAYELDTTSPNRYAIAQGGTEGATVLSPAQALRLFHPPYGTMQGRGLTGERYTDIALPSVLSTSPGIELGVARVSYGSYDRDTAVQLSPESRRHHVYILGRSGSGKTNLLKHMARQDIAAGHGIAVIDPHGDLVDYLVQQVGGREQDVVLLDFGDHDYLPVMNPLDLDVRDDLDRVLAIEEFIDLVERQSFHEFYGPRFRDLVRLAIDSVLDENYPIKERSLVDFPPILRSDERRAWLRGILRNRALRDRWSQFEDQSPNERAEVLHWALAKFTELTEDNILGQVLGGGTSTISIASAVEDNAILLVKIPEWEMSRSAADFLGAFVQERVRRAIYSRWRQRESMGETKPYHLYVDEFQAFATTRFEDMLAEARKFGLCLTLAHQNVRQLQRFSRHTGTASSGLLEAVFGNVSTMIYFGGSSTDDRVMAAELGIDEAQLRRLRRYTAVARVMLDDASANCTLQIPLATSVAGLPKAAESVRQRMINGGTWVTRGDLRERLAGRLRRITRFTHEEDELPSWLREQRTDSAEHSDSGLNESVPNPPSTTNSAVQAGDAKTNNLYVSWPLEEDSISNVSYELRDDQLHIIINPSASGIRFNRELVRFVDKASYPQPIADKFNQRVIAKRQDRRPLVVTFPSPEGLIDKVSYTVDNDVFTLIVLLNVGSPPITHGSVKFTRGVLLRPDMDEEVSDEQLGA